MNFTRTLLFVHIADINKQIKEHERLVLVCKDKTASFSYKRLGCVDTFSLKK